MPTEFLHGLFDGGAGAGLEDYWKLMSAQPGARRRIHLGVGRRRREAARTPARSTLAGNQAPDGIVGPYREREGSFYTIKEIWSPIQVTRETNGTFTVENHYSFTDANQCKFTWQLRGCSGRMHVQIPGFSIVSAKRRVDTALLFRRADEGNTTPLSLCFNAALLNSCRAADLLRCGWMIPAGASCGPGSGR